MQHASSYVNIAAYHFLNFADYAERRGEFQKICSAQQLKGTILITPEGINLFLAGLRENIDAFMAWLRSDVRFKDITVKESTSPTQPFKRMLVKLKREVITLRAPEIKPLEGRAPGVSPATLKRWLDQGHDDEGKAVVMMDTRNAFEVDIGRFENTIDYRISKFTEFPAVAKAHREEFADKAVVTYCTGGVRCEKAVIYMKNIGYDRVYQLDGGILQYFEDVGGAHYEGDCFVFDERVALTPELAPACNAA